MEQKSFIIYKDRDGKVIATVPAPPGAVVVNPLVVVVDGPEDIPLQFMVTDIRIGGKSVSRPKPKTLQEWVEENVAHLARKRSLCGWPIKLLN